MSFGCNSCSAIQHNIGRIVRVFTETGGLAGIGFTGVLIEVNDDFIKLITELPSAPSHPFGVHKKKSRGCFCGGDCFGGDCFGGGCDHSRFGTITVIACDQITAFSVNDI